MFGKPLKQVNPQKLDDREILIALSSWGCTLAYVKNAREVFLTGVRMYIYDVAVTLNQLTRLRTSGLVRVIHDTGNVVRYEVSTRGLETIGFPEDGYKA